MENEILEAISHIKNVSKKSPTAEKILNHISKTSASNIDLTFVNETIKQLIVKNKINDNFKIVEPENGNLNQPFDEVQADEFNETLDGSPTAPQFTDEKELEILIIATIATWKVKNKKWCGAEEVFNLVKDSLETGLKRENFNECLGDFISNKSLKHNTINSIECLSLLKDEIKHDDSNNNDGTISHYNTISHDDTCVLKEYFNSYQVKCIKELQNVKDAFLKKLSDVEQNLEKNLEKRDMMKNMRDF